MPGMTEVDAHPHSDFPVREQTVDRLLFGGAITCSVPVRFLGSQRLKKRRGLPVELIEQPRLRYTFSISSFTVHQVFDVSDIREVPDNQEVLCDYDREESIFIELLELKSEVTDDDSARWFLHNVAEEQEAENTVILEDRRVLTDRDVPNMPASTVMNAASGYMTVTKGRQPIPLHNAADAVAELPPSAKHLVEAHLADIRLRNVETDLVVTVNRRLDERPENQSSAAVESVNLETARDLLGSDVLNLILRTLKIEDWTLFASSAGSV